MNVSRERIHINGIVQGVGFRPFVYRLAKQCNLVGFVNNNSKGVLVEIEGPQIAIKSFHHKLTEEAPAFSKIISIKKEIVNSIGETDFKIVETNSSEKANTLISPDISLCDDCLRELFDPDNRRFQYPFINCTNCGPRYTIIKTIPYDRPYTSMNAFEMCAACEKEYNDPLNRRFHAQPNACPECGPYIKLSDKNGNPVDVENVIVEAARLINKGKILAIRGLGGFHLAVDPFNRKALQDLRMRKGRQDKPFALMAKDIESVKKYCVVSEREKECLNQATRPIVILKAFTKTDIPGQIAPGNNYLGFMLPYTPVHHLLMTHFDVLVMTSANFTDEPITIGNKESFKRLQNIADYFLGHNREILQRCDDSIVRIIDGNERMIRRSRGYVPAPLFTKEASKKNILAVGGELKNTIALSRGNEVFFSQYIGDLDNPEAYNFFENSIVHLQDILQIKPQIIACDIHPEYLSSKWAKKQNLPLIEVQHHHAHLAAASAENQIDEPVIGIILDGTGYGTDGTIWGGEVLIGDANDFERFAWLDPVAMPGGSVAIKEPWRMAYSYLRKSLDAESINLNLPILDNISEQNIRLLDKMIDQNLNSPLTSSCGRLFDAVSAMLGICNLVTFEAQAAIELEMLADEKELNYYEKVITSFGTFSENLVLDNLIAAIIKDLWEKIPVPIIAARFHNTIAEIFLHTAVNARKEKNINIIALSGGVYQNMFLFNVLTQKLKNKNFEVISHSKVPSNDGGLALGQIVIANKKLGR